MSLRNYFAIGLLVTVVLVSLVAWQLLKTSPAAPELIVTPTETLEPADVETPWPQVIGRSVEGRAIEYYHFGTGEKLLLLVGGIHGGYEWNSVVLAYEFIDALLSEEISVPDTISIGIIPALNPDGLYNVTEQVGRIDVSLIPENDAHTTGRGRFNANNVDLNRNFACKWQRESTWRGRTVSAGTAAFSEPEAMALRDLVLNANPAAVVFWHSQANAVYASECEAGVLPATLTYMTAYAQAANYLPVASFDAYPISGDAEGWLASINIPALTVELETRTSSEWSRNLAGVKALLSALE